MENFLIGALDKYKRDLEASPSNLKLFKDNIILEKGQGYWAFYKDKEYAKNKSFENLKLEIKRILGAWN